MLAGACPPNPKAEHIRVYTISLHVARQIVEFSLLACYFPDLLFKRTFNRIFAAPCIVGKYRQCGPAGFVCVTGSLLAAAGVSPARKARSMRCPTHLLREAVGYCQVCGSFGCADCLTFHEGQYYCKRDYKPIQDEIERKRKHEAQRTRTERQRLVVHTRKGEVYYGVCFALNPNHDAFKLELMTKDNEPAGKTQAFNFKDLKAIFYVKAFDGEFDRSKTYAEETPEGGGVVAVFEDGEVLKGHTYQAYHGEAPRFHLIPDDRDGNNLSILIERAALKGLYTPEEYHELKKREIKEYVKAHAGEGKDNEELIGDYYFERKDSRRALSHYYKAVEAVGQTPALLKKIVATEYNTAMMYLRDKHLTHALHHLEKARKFDEGNEAVLQKIAQIRQKLRLDRTKDHAGVD